MGKPSACAQKVSQLADCDRSIFLDITADLAFHLFETESVDVEIVGHDINLAAFDQEGGHRPDSIRGCSHGVGHDADMRRLCPTDENALFYALH